MGIQSYACSRDNNSCRMLQLDSRDPDKKEKIQSRPSNAVNNRPLLLSGASACRTEYLYRRVEQFSEADTGYQKRKQSCPLVYYSNPGHSRYHSILDVASQGT